MYVHSYLAKETGDLITLFTLKDPSLQPGYQMTNFCELVLATVM